MQEAVFALKGGTAINLFEWDMPRLSVDIDLTYLPTQGRDESLAAISSALDRVAASIERRLIPTKVTKPVQGGERMEVMLNCQRQRTQVKIEVNPTLRGHLSRSAMQKVWRHWRAISAINVAANALGGNWRR